MYKQIKSRLKNVIDARFDAVMETQQLHQQTILSYNQIAKLFSEDVFLPLTYWSISPTTILHVLNDIYINKRKFIIEFGGGASTIFIAKLIKTHQLETTLYTVESDEVWAGNLRNQLRDLDIDQHVKIIHSPICNVGIKHFYKEQTSWYDTKILSEQLNLDVKYDLILVDGPVGADTPYARYSAIPFLKESIAENFSVFLDDVHRPFEREIALAWHKILPSKITFIERYVVLSNDTQFDVTPFHVKKIEVLN